ncbi:hypothetical protein SDC9_188359 [bioreactor metagenome]|uniref:Uncharacterized protein n=1 Tax=bioreactor metagenome TaxID=1076179 RepID=A0A645HRI5_9ZZZZ|nr:hypothetical protein [Lutispora sp.]MEA4962290.1 hypothetical protein [Lutispora sp.]
MAILQFKDLTKTYGKDNITVTAILNKTQFTDITFSFIIRKRVVMEYD